jgi:hypothetical protein
VLTRVETWRYHGNLKERERRGHCNLQRELGGSWQTKTRERERSWQYKGGGERESSWLSREKKRRKGDI